MQQRTSSLRDSVRIHVNTDIDRVSLDDGHVPVRNIVMAAIVQMDAERFERVRRDQVSDLFRGYHHSSLPERFAFARSRTAGKSASRVTVSFGALRRKEGRSVKGRGRPRPRLYGCCPPKAGTRPSPRLCHEQPLTGSNLEKGQSISDASLGLLFKEKEFIPKSMKMSCNCAPFLQYRLVV